MNEPKQDAVGTGPDPGATSKRRWSFSAMGAVALGIFALLGLLALGTAMVMALR